MTITTNERTDLLALAVSMFNAAPRKSYLDPLISSFEAGKTRAELIATMSASTEFSQAHASSLSAEDFATRLATAMLGNEVSVGANAWATNWVKTQISAGMDKAAVIGNAVQALLSTTNVDFANAKAMLLNKVDVASYAASFENILPNTSTFPEFLKDVTSDPATAVFDKTLVDASIIPAGLFARVAWLRPILDRYSGGGSSFSGSDSYIAHGAETLSSGDLLAGFAGYDTLFVYDTASFVIREDITIREIETVNFMSFGDITADVTPWAGVLTLNVNSNAGDVVIKAAGITDVAVTVGDGKFGTTSGMAVEPVTVNITGGASISITTHSDVVATVMNSHAGMKLVFDQAHGTAEFGDQKISLAADASLQAYQDMAASAFVSANTRIRWFQFQGDTYVVADNSESFSFVSGSDTLVKLTGLVNVNEAGFAAVANTSASLTLV